MHADEEQLARYQGALLELLGEDGVDARVAAERLARDPEFGPFREHVAAFEPRMLETAIELVRRWGRRL